MSKITTVLFRCMKCDYLSEQLTEKCPHCKLPTRVIVFTDNDVNGMPINEFLANYKEDGDGWLKRIVVPVELHYKDTLPRSEQRIVRCDWAQVNKGLRRLAYTVKRSSFKVNSVHGIARGGLPVAVMLSHMLKVPYAHGNAVTPQTLIVDDIVDSGAQMKYWLDKGYLCCALYVKPQWQHVMHAFVALDNDWVRFAWEKESYP